MADPTAEDIAMWCRKNADACRDAAARSTHDGFFEEAAEMISSAVAYEHVADSIRSGEIKAAQGETEERT